jgi:hypothetical protein
MYVSFYQYYKSYDLMLSYIGHKGIFVFVSESCFFLFLIVRA